MGILPENKPQKTIDKPRNFFIYGGTMEGKSYMSGEFPNVLFLDTDGNAKANPYPSIELRNKKVADPAKKNGWRFEETVIDQLDQIITELQTTKHSYETIVLDVIDDIIVLIEQAICAEAEVDTISDIPYGKGYAKLSSVIQELAIELKSLPMYVIYVSRINTYTDNSNVEHQVPSLKEKYVNIVNGNSDLLIQCQKIGKSYLRRVRSKRKNYDRENIDDERLVKILDTVTGVYEKSSRIKKSEQDKIIKNDEEATQEKIIKKRTKPEINKGE